MRKMLLLLLAVVVVGSACYGMGSSPSSSPYAGQPKLIITGEVESSQPLFGKGLKVNMIDDNKDKTSVYFQIGTTADWPAPMNKRLEVIYFVAEDGKNIALSVKEISRSE